MEPDKGVIRKAAKEKIASDLSKQAAYEELAKEFKYRNIVADVVRYVPARHLKQKYDFLNIICLVIISLGVVLKISAQNFSGILWLGFMIYAIADRQYKYYYWLAIIGIVSLAASLFVFFRKDMQSTVDIMALALDVAIAGFLLYCGTMLPRMMTPPYEEKKKAYINAKGEKKLMVVHIFKEDTEGAGTLDDVFQTP
jgi:hypothetical protein